MRPKKKILLVDVDENRRSVLSYVLRVWGYKVRGNFTPGGVARSLQRFNVDLVIFQASLPEKWLADAAYDAHMVRPFTKTLLASDRLREAPLGIFFDSALLKAEYNMFEIRERVRLLSERKRGPRLGSVRNKPVQAITLADVLDIRRVA